MVFAPTQVDGSVSPLPLSSAVPDGTNTPLPIEGGPVINTGGNNLVPVSVYVKDGNNVVEGITTDAAVTGDTSGTFSAKLRGLVKIFTDIWDSTNHLFNVGPARWNETTWDKNRGNTDNITVLASAARTTTTTSADLTNFNARGVVICVDTTVNAVACSNVVTISGKDPVSGKYQVLLTGAAIVAVGTVFFTIYPGATPATNLAVSLPLPRTFKVTITSGNANSATYSVGASFIL
jgi:hypothetical protein